MYAPLAFHAMSCHNSSVRPTRLPPPPSLGTKGFKGEPRRICHGFEGGRNPAPPRTNRKDRVKNVVSPASESGGFHNPALLRRKGIHHPWLCKRELGGCPHCHQTISLLSGSPGSGRHNGTPQTSSLCSRSSLQRDILFRSLPELKLMFNF